MTTYLLAILILAPCAKAGGIVDKNGGENIPAMNVIYSSTMTGQVAIGDGVIQTTATVKAGGVLTIAAGAVENFGLEIVSNCQASVNTVAVSCTAGKLVIGGGCNAVSQGYPLDQSYPSAVNTWTCDKTVANDSTMCAYAICARVR